MTRNSSRAAKSICDFDRQLREGPVLLTPRSQLACSQEGVDPHVDLLHKVVRDFVLPCKGDRAAAKLKADNWANRRDELLKLLIHKRSAIMEAMEAQRSDMHGGTFCSSLDISSRERSAQRDTASEGSLDDPGSQSGDERSRQLSPSGAGSGTGFSGERSRGEGNQLTALTKKQKLEKQIERMRQVVENNKARQALHDEESRRKLELFAKQEHERAVQKEQDELERKFKEVQLRRRAQQDRLAREAREAEHHKKMEEERAAREAIARELEEKEQVRRQRQERERMEMEHLNALRQMDVAERQEAKKRAAEELEEDRRRSIKEKMHEADERRIRLEDSKEAEMEARKLVNEMKTKENREKRDRANELFVRKITRFVEKAKIAEDQRRQQREELENYFLYCKLEEAKREKLRHEVLERARAEEAQREGEMKARLEEAEARIRELMHEKERNAALRKVEKDIILENKLHQMERNRRLLQHECEEGKARFEEKIRRITEMQKESQEADMQRRDLMRRSLLAMKRRPPEPTPGPADYAAVAASGYVAHRDGGVKISTGARQPLFGGWQQGTTPGPGQYQTNQATLRSKGGKLRPLSFAEKKRLEVEARKSPTRSLLLSGSTTRALRELSPVSGDSGPSWVEMRSVSAPLPRPQGVTDDDYNSDDDFEDAPDGVAQDEGATSGCA